uniref:Uncharacterized protein n=1 Tax=Rhipicephalus zambeziensis TaxID=60191 RepID=A0A224Y662_9ACAR
MLLLQKHVVQRHTGVDVGLLLLGRITDDIVQTRGRVAYQLRLERRVCHRFEFLMLARRLHHSEATKTFSPERDRKFLSVIEERSALMVHVCGLARAPRPLPLRKSEAPTPIRLFPQHPRAALEHTHTTATTTHYDHANAARFLRTLAMMILSLLSRCGCHRRVDAACRYLVAR